MVLLAVEGGVAAPVALYDGGIGADGGEEAQFFGTGDGEAGVEHLVRDGEDGGVGADGQSERGDGDGGEAGGFAENANRVAEVGAEVVEEAKAESGANVVFDGVGRAKLEAGLPGGITRREALQHEVLGVGLQVKAEFVIHVGFKAGAMDEGAQEDADAIPDGGGHRADSCAPGAAVSLRTAARMRAISRQRSVSLASWRWPRSVRV